MKADEILLEDLDTLKAIFKNNSGAIINKAHEFLYDTTEELIRKVKSLNFKIDIKKASRSVLIVVLAAATLISSQPQIKTQLQQFVSPYLVSDVSNQSVSISYERSYTAEGIVKLLDQDIGKVMKQLNTEEVVTILTLQAKTENPYQRYMDYFEKLTGVKPTSRIAAVDLGAKNGVIGYCNRALIDEQADKIIEPIIIINSVFWNKKTEAQKKAIIVHELGHCELGLSHIPEPDNVMSPAQAGGKNIDDPETAIRVYKKFKAYASACGNVEFQKGKWDLVDFSSYSGGCELRRLIGRWDNIK